MAESTQEVATERLPYYLALDPGKATGWATWDQDGIWLDMGTVWSHQELDELLSGFPTSIKVVIYEDFILFPNKAKAQIGSRMPASVAIGKIETYAHLWGATMYQQPSGIKSIAERLTGKFTKGMAHNRTHVIDAYNHGEYWLIQNKIKQVKL
jgi:hypothetical protein